MRNVLLLSLLFVFVSHGLKAATYYWVGGDYGAMDVAANWSTTLGGAGGSVVPGSADFVIVDGSNIGGGLAGEAFLYRTSNMTVRRFILQNGASVKLLMRYSALTFGRSSAADGAHLLVETGSKLILYKDVNLTAANGSYIQIDGELEVYENRAFNMQNSASAIVNGSLLVKGTLNCGAKVITGTGSVTFEDGATLSTALPIDAASGSIRTSGATYADGMNFTFTNGGAIDAGAVPSSLYGVLSMNGTGTLTISQPLTIGQGGTLDYMTGTINPNSNLILADGCIISRGNGSLSTFPALPAWYDLVYRGVDKSTGTEFTGNVRNLTVNLANATNIVTQQIAKTIPGTLTLSKGLWNTGGREFKLTKATQEMVKSGSKDSYITGLLTLELPAGYIHGTMRLPVGTGANFQMLELQNTTTDAPVTLTLRAYDAGTGGTAGVGMSALEGSPEGTGLYYHATVTGGNISSRVFYSRATDFSTDTWQLAMSSAEAGTYSHIPSLRHWDYKNAIRSDSAITFLPVTYFKLGVIGIWDNALRDTYIGKIKTDGSYAVDSIGKGVLVGTFRQYLTVSPGATFEIYNADNSIPADTDTLTGEMRVDVTSFTGSVRSYDLVVPRPLACKVTEAPINISDGLIDSQWDLYYPVAEDAYAIENQVVNPGFSASDLTASFRLLSDTDYLYILVEVQDDAIQGLENFAGPWADDCVELFIDANNSKGTTYETVPVSEPIDFQLGFVPGSPTVFKGYMNNNSAFTDIDLQVDFDQGTTAEGYWMEIRFPWDALDVTITPGHLFGLDIGINDDDDGGERDGKLGWYDAHERDWAWDKPCVFGTLEALLYLPDLRYATHDIDLTTLMASDTLNAEVSIHNSGLAHPESECKLRFYLSQDNANLISPADVQLGQWIEVPRVDKGSTSATLSSEVVIPSNTYEGLYYLKLFIDADKELFELSENNNIAIHSLVVTAPDTSRRIVGGTWFDLDWQPAVPGSATVTFIESGIVDIVSRSCQTGSLTVRPGAGVTISANRHLQVNGDLVLESPENSGATAGLVDATTTGNGLTVTGTATIERFVTRNEWHYLSSPVQNASTKVLTRLTGVGWNPNVFSYDESAIWPDGWTTAHDGKGGSGLPLVPGTGYAVFSNVYNTFLFKGIPNSGNLNLTLSATDHDLDGLDSHEGWNLVGNPYPSPVNWDDMIAQGLVSDVDHALYFWDGNKYSCYVAGGTWYAPAGIVTSPYIPAMQSFFVKASGMSPAINFRNTVREHNSTILYKKQVAEPSLVLSVSGNAQTDGLYLRNLPGATPEHDGAFDAYKLLTDDPAIPQLFSITQAGTKLAVATEPFWPATMQLGFQGQGEFTISLDRFYLPDNQRVFLVDQQTGITSELGKSSYTFVHDASSSETRFTLQFDCQTGIEQPVLKQDVAVYRAWGDVVVSVPETTERYTVEIVDMNGKCLWNSEETTSVVRIGMGDRKGIFVVKVNQSSACSSHKVVF